ncbi:nucleotide sugar dehydrogenase [Belnapia sp. F-4-1]|uniref:nucleotide sugar dehydrogenase n=1 Tax=Belnapia sp. F-4-1 TaxID=1545443 RepID=UPI000692069D|nr:nucleotide sugar dehydrogenase [Belnapia sp. F-4-1]
MPDSLPPCLPRLPSLVEPLAARFRQREATIAVIGLGYVGLPLILALVETGFHAIGLDADAGRLADLAAGRSPLRQIASGEVLAALHTNRLRLTGEGRALAEADAILVCVPTPLGPHREPDLSAVESATRLIAAHLRRGQLVILESTSYPGTTRGVMQPLLEETGLRCGRDFFLAHAPEREDPGNVQHRTVSIPRVIGGTDPASLDLALALYGAFVARTVPVGSADVAEAVKLTENTFRAVNIALMNELKLVFEPMGIDIWEVIEAARTKPFGYMPFFPGPGLGGHCIPVDPHYLTWQARAHGVATRFIDLASEINAAMPRHVLDRLAEALDRQQGRGLRGSRILVIGLGYKRNLEDLRHSPALVLMEMLEARGAEVLHLDPLVPVIPPQPDHPGLVGRRGIAPGPEALAGIQAGLIVTDHDGIDYAGLVAALPLLVDTRNACARLGLTGPHIVKA